MNTWVLLLIKFVMTLIITVVSFSFLLRSPLGWVFLVAIVTTIVNYLVGDLYILPGFGIYLSSIGEGILGAFAALIVGLTTIAFNPAPVTLLLFGFLIAVGEFIFHPYFRTLKKQE